MAFSFDILTIGAILSTSGITLANIDENTTGGDDYAGNLLIYAGDLITAIHSNEDLPPLPELIMNGAATKITGNSRVSLILAASLLPFLMAGAPGKFRTAIRYLQQALQQLLAGKVVPPIPPEIKAILTAAPVKVKA